MPEDNLARCSSRSGRGGWSRDGKSSEREAVALRLRPSRIAGPIGPAIRKYGLASCRRVATPGVVREGCVIPGTLFSGGKHGIFKLKAQVAFQSLKLFPGDLASGKPFLQDIEG